MIIDRKRNRLLPLHFISHHLLGCKNQDITASFMQSTHEYFCSLYVLALLVCRLCSSNPSKDTFQEQSGNLWLWYYDNILSAYGIDQMMLLFTLIAAELNWWGEERRETRYNDQCKQKMEDKCDTRRKKNGVKGDREARWYTTATETDVHKKRQTSSQYKRKLKFISKAHFLLGKNELHFWEKALKGV